MILRRVGFYIPFALLFVKNDKNDKKTTESKMLLFFMAKRYKIL